jgi:hypothetical protein
MHGYLIIDALVLHTILILKVIVPSFTGNFGEVGELAAIASLTVWSHVVLGIIAEVLGITLIGAWLSKPRSKMICKNRKGGWRPYS